MISPHAVSELPPTAPSRPRWWWVPLALIALALTVLGLVPLVTNSRVAALRRHSSDVTEPALVVVNDLEAALATESAVAGPAARHDAAAIAELQTARATVDDDEARLDSLVAQAGPEAVADLASARTAIAVWQRGRTADDAGGESLDLADQRRWESLRLALVATRRLDDALTRSAVRERGEIRRIIARATAVPLALVPVTLLALAGVVLAARRTLVLVEQAHEGRVAAERAMTAKAALIRGVTHDIKNPLGAAAGYADLLADGAIGELTAEQRRVAARLRRLLGVSVDTVNDLLDVSRTEAGELRVEHVATDVAAAVRDIVDDYGASAAAAGVTLVLDEMPAAARVALESDPARVRQVLGNLLSNALKYTPAGATVRIRLALVRDRRVGRALAVEVADDGPGIPESLHDRVFDEFFRVPSAGAVAAGSGVGLAIGRRVARLLGGDLRLTSTAGSGATFTLLLPVEAASAEHADGRLAGATAGA